MAAYLQALGVLRIVAEQKDASATGWWDDDTFVLRSSLDMEALMRFLLEEYAPTPVIAPWNGGSGFFPSDNTSGIAAIEADESARFAPYRAAIATARSTLQHFDLRSKPADARVKEMLVVALRDELDDSSVAWLDAALVLTQDGLRYPPLLGTGGNDGRLDFTNNQMQWLAKLLIDKVPSSAALLRATVLGTATTGVMSAAIGQFAPASAGGANAGQGFYGNARVNGWQYVLMIEGALLFAARLSRRLESARPGVLAYPFSVQASGSGYASASTADESRSRNEIWLPLWRRPADLHELRAVFGEGRAHVGRRQATTGIDFARAVSSLSVDRGIAGFARYGFHVRNGLAYFATPLGRWDVRRNERVDLIRALDGWLDRLRRATSDRDAPARLRIVHRQIEESVLALCRDDSPRGLQGVLIALGAAERALARSRGFTMKKGLRPVPRLSRDWLRQADDRSVEFGLAESLCSVDIRRNIVPVATTRSSQWTWEDDAQVVWGSGELIDNLLAVLQRRQIEEGREPPFASSASLDSDASTRTARLDDVARFIDGQIDESRLDGLIAGLACCDSRRTRSRMEAARGAFQPPAIYSLLKVVTDRYLRPDLSLPATPGLITRAAAGDSQAASTLAIRRLRSAGYPTIMRPFAEDIERTRRSAAAILFPIDERERDQLIRSICAPQPSTFPQETAS